MHEPADFIYRNVTLLMTCFACPEQYNAFDDVGVQIGYLRLRHGEFRVDVPDRDGENVLCASPRGHGMFDMNERESFLKLAIDAILEHGSPLSSSQG